MKETTHTMYCIRPKEAERCNGTSCIYEHIWIEESKIIDNKELTAK